MSMYFFVALLLVLIGTATSDDSYKCPSREWVYRREDDTCYLHNGQRVGHEQGMRFCQDNNSSLVSISDMPTNNFVSSLAHGAPIWIGLFSVEDFKDHEIGSGHPIITIYNCEKHKLGIFPTANYGTLPGQKLPITRIWKWMDGSPSSFFVWSQGNLDSKDSIKRLPSPICTDACCGVFMDREGMWRDIPLSKGAGYPFGRDDFSNGVVCSKKLKDDNRTVNKTLLAELPIPYFTQLLNWDKDIDWMDRVIYERMGHFDNKIDVTQDYLRSLESLVKELAALMLVIFIIVFITLVLVSFMFITRLRNKRQNNHRNLRGFHSFRRLSVSSDFPESVLFKNTRSTNNNQEGDLLTPDL